MASTNQEREREREREKKTYHGMYVRGIEGKICAQKVSNLFRSEMEKKRSQGNNKMQTLMKKRWKNSLLKQHGSFVQWKFRGKSCVVMIL